MSFDPNKHMIKTRGGKDYLPVAARLVWFRLEHADWGIVTEPHTIDMEQKYAIYRATIMDGSGKIIATATKQESARDFPDFLEKAETGSIGRALAMCGYGTQFAPEFEEGDRFADAPGGYGSGQDRRPGGGLARENGVVARDGGYPARESGAAAPSAKLQGRPVPTGVTITRVREEVADVNLDPAGDHEDEDESSLEEFEEMPAPPARPAMAAAPAPRTAPQNPPVPPRPTNGSGGGNGLTLTQTRCSVEGCPAILTQSQLTSSTGKFGRPLCPLHQRDAQPLPLGDGARPLAGAAR